MGVGGRDGEGPGAEGTVRRGLWAELGARREGDRGVVDVRGDGVGVGGRDGEGPGAEGAGRKGQGPELGARREEDRGDVD
eukprot:700020-Hanusia_phi.AAC.1